MRLFRKSALDALSTPEKLDQPIELIRPSGWLLLTSFTLFVVYILLWSIFGRIPVRLEGRGVLISPNTVFRLQSEKEGRLISINGDIGSCFKAGDELARIDPYQLKLRRDSQLVKYNQEIDQLRQLKSQNNTEVLAERKQLIVQNNQVNRIKPLINEGLMSLDSYEDELQSARALEARIKASQNRRATEISSQEQVVAVLKDDIDKLDTEIKRLSSLNAAADGCIVGRHFQPGDYIQPQQPILDLDTNSSDKKLISLAFFPAKDGKRLRLDQPVVITPSVTKAQRHGGISGKISTISPVHASESALLLKLGNQNLVDFVLNTSSSDKRPSVEIATTLDEDDQTVSGFDWGGSEGPDLTLTSGTTTTIKVIVEQRRPINYVIPILRDLTGIY